MGEARRGERFFLVPWVAAALIACRDPSTRVPEPTPEATAETEGGTEPTRRLPPAAPHGSAIQTLAVAPDASAALSVDKRGQVRLWTDLRGDREPFAIEIGTPRALSLAKRGTGWLLSFVDTAGGVQLVAVDAAGSHRTVAELPPAAPTRGVAVLAGREGVLLLGEDHSVRLLSDVGEVLATLERRAFRPRRLLVGPDGSAVAVTMDRDGNGATVLAARRLAIGEKSVELAGDPIALPTVGDVGAEAIELSPDGARLAWAERPASTWQAKILEVSTGTARAIDLAMHEGQRPAFGFVTPRQVFVTSRERDLAWLVDIENGSRRPRVGTLPIGQPMPIVFADGVQVVGYGTWLGVQRPLAREQVYLGWRGFFPQGGAVSPAGKWVAWGMTGELLVEPFDGSADPVRVPLPSFFGAQFLAFLDEDHLVAAIGDGSLRMVAWKEGRIIDELGLGNGAQGVHFDLARNLVVVHRLWGDVAAVEVRDRRFVGPLLIADSAARVGVARVGSGAGVWTLDGSQALRVRSLESLRGDPPAGGPAAEGRTLAVSPGSVVMSVDTAGRWYSIIQDGLSQTLERRSETASELKVSVGSHRVSQVAVSPDGSTVLAVADTGTLLAFDGETLAALWSWSHGPIQWAPSFSGGGRYVVVAAAGGGVLLDARTGRPVHRRCGIEFRAQKAPPFDAFSIDAPSLCE